MINAIGETLRKLRKDHRVTIARLSSICESGASYRWNLDHRSYARRHSSQSPHAPLRIAPHLDLMPDDSTSRNVEDARDALFFRQYRNMPRETKMKIRQMVRLWADD